MRFMSISCFAFRCRRKRERLQRRLRICTMVRFRTVSNLHIAFNEPCTCALPNESLMWRSTRWLSGSSAWSSSLSRMVTTSCPPVSSWHSHCFVVSENRSLTPAMIG